MFTNNDLKWCTSSDEEEKHLLIMTSGHNLHTSSWSPVGPDIYYRRVHLYNLLWRKDYEIDIDNFQVISSPLAGCIVLAEKSKKKGLSGNVWIFSAAGKLISVLKEIAESVTLLFLTREEHLVTVANDGQVCIYELKGTLKRSYIIDPEVRQHGIREAVSFCNGSATGIALVSKTGRFFVVSDVNAALAEKYPTLPDSGIPSAWCFIAASNHAILAAQDNQLFHINKDRCLQTTIDFKDPDFKTIDRMCSSMTGSNVALVTDTQTLWFGKVTEDATMIRKTEYNPKSNYKLMDMCCAGPDGVITVLSDSNTKEYALVMVLGFDNYFCSLSLRQPMRLIQELDGVRIIGNETHELIELVPSPIVNVLRIGSIADGAHLLAAKKEYDRKSYKADECLQLIKDHVQAVKECIDAAAHEYDTSDQKSLLQAALLGKRLTPDQNVENFLGSCKQLRVLNEVREAQVGIPITFKQFQELGLHALIDRLVSRGNYSTAVNICEYLEIPKERGVLRILKKWATEKVHESEFDDDASAEKIHAKLGSRPGISYSDIAQEAVRRGRKLLAIRLLDFEVKASRQIPLLLLLEQHKTAIEKSIDSGDPHLLFSVIQKLQRQFPERDFIALMTNYPQAMTLMRQIDSLHGKLPILDDDHNRNGMTYLKNGLGETNAGTASKSLQTAAAYFKKVKQDFAVAALEEQQKLIRLQTRLKEKSRFECVGMSVSETIKALLRDNQYRVAEDVRKDFKVSEKRFWWLKIEVLVDKRDWLELDKLSKSKKSPIGYEPFVDLCLKVGERIEATKYVHRVDPNFRVTYLIKVG